MHLMGVGDLLHLWLVGCETEPRVEEFGGFLMENYFYFVTLSTLTVGGHGRAREIFNRTMSLLSDERFLSSPGFGHVCGDLHELLLCVPRIGSLPSQNSNHGHDERDHDEYRDIYAVLERWQLPPNTDMANFLCAEIYRQSLFIYLAMMCPCQFGVSGIPGHGDIQDEVQMRLEVALEHLDDLGAQNPTSIVLNFPLAIMGCCAHTAEHQNKIKHRLLQLYQADGMNNFRVVIDLLSKLWAQGESEGELGDSSRHFQSFRSLGGQILIG